MRNELKLSKNSPSILAVGWFNIFNQISFILPNTFVFALSTSLFSFLFLIFESFIPRTYKPTSHF